MQFRIGERLASVLTLVLFLVAGAAYAQQTESRIIGKVLDSSKAALPGVTVTGHVEGHRRHARSRHRRGRQLRHHQPRPWRIYGQR